MGSRGAFDVDEAPAGPLRDVRADAARVVTPPREGGGIKSAQLCGGYAREGDGGRLAEGGGANTGVVHDPTDGTTLDAREVNRVSEGACGETCMAVP